MINSTIQNLLDEQLTSWKTATDNYAALAQVREKEVVVNGTRYKVQFNPARIISSAAKVDDKSIRERKCFLCPAHRPAAQKGLLFNERYHLLMNPFPIFPRHLTVPALEHTSQLIQGRFTDMLDLAATATDYVVFYNGPRCGASAPDHVHFQAGNKGFLPIEEDWEKRQTKRVGSYGAASLWQLNDAPRATLVITSPTRDDAAALFHIVYDAMELKSGEEEEPLMNLLVWLDEDGHWVVCIFPRAQHRPTCYTAAGEANLLISPASVDMGGVFITPREKDFEKITTEDIAAMLSEVCLSPTQLEELTERIKDRL